MQDAQIEAVPRTRRDQVRNRAALIGAARQVFADHGIDAPLDAVAKSAGLSNATLYRHFSTRESLIVEVYRLSLADHLERFAALHVEDDPWRAFVDHATWTFRGQFTDRALTRGLAAIPNGIDADLDEQRRAARDAFSALIDAAKRQGRFRPDRWIDDVLLFFAANETLTALGETARPASDRLLHLMLDSMAVERAIDSQAVVPEPLTMDSVLTHHLAQA